LVIGGVAVIARLTGCQPDQQEPCMIGSLAVSKVIDNALLAAGVSIRVSAHWRDGFYLILACCWSPASSL
jgi:hypothetical protein